MNAKNLQIKRALRNALLVLLLSVAGMTKSLAQSTVGTDFWVTFLPNYHTDSGHPLTLSLIATASSPCSGIITNPYTNWSTSFEVSVGATTIIDIPSSEAYSEVDSDCIVNIGLHVEATDSISLFACNFRPYTFDVTDVLPTYSLGSNYIIQTYNEDSRGVTMSPSSHQINNRHDSSSSEFTILAVEDNTTVYITLTNNSLNGHYANQPFSVTLNSGQCYQIQSFGGDFSGSQVSVSGNKRVAVFAGNLCTNVPFGCSYCDHIVEQMMPVSCWGTHFVVTNSYSRYYDVVRVTAANNGCQIFANGSLVTTINQKETYQFEITDDNPSMYLETSEPSMVYLYYAGSECAGENGDPSMVMISPIEQRMDYVTFSTFNSGASQYHFVNVITNTNEVASVQLDGNSIASEFHTVSGNSGYSFARVAIEHGSHTLSTTGNGFVAHVYGLGDDESYAYSVGSNAHQELYTNMLVNGQIAPSYPESMDVCGKTINFDLNYNYDVSQVNWTFGDGQTGSGIPITHEYANYGDYTVSCNVFKLDSYGQNTLVATLTTKLHIYESQNTHEYVDLGLPSGTFWATCNVGADTPEGCGDYFAWGEIQPKEYYNWGTYQHCNGSASTLTKYCNKSNYGYNGFTDDLTTLSPEDDAATANWGNDWRMPTVEDWEELCQNTTGIWTTQNGVKGRLFTAPNGNSLFLPITGYRDGSNLIYIPPFSSDSCGLYWLNRLDTINPTRATYFSAAVNLSGFNTIVWSRHYGQTVRPVRSTNIIPTGAINGIFSVSESQQVYFSQGNLQYKATTNTWRFAENQWDCLRLENANISSSYDGWIDLFGWGTSGYDHGAVCYQPWSSSTNGSDYYAYGSSTYNLYDQTGQADWGYNAISNGGNTQNQWRTLTNDEWSYLIFNRNTPSGIRFAKAVVNNIEGLVVLPDNWDSSIYGLQNTNTASATYSSNIITENDWASVLEPHGVLFLPSGSYRSGSSYIEPLDKGYYWTSTRSGEGTAAYFEFNNIQNESIGLFVGGRGLGQGLSVRLAKTVQNNGTYTINTTCSPIEGGSVTGVGTYNAGETCTLTVTANEGYIFVNWTENGNVVSSNSTLSFIVSCNRNLVANFEQIINNHWTPVSASYSDVMTMNCVIQIDGVEQYSDMLEVGVFCGNECRGSAFAVELPFMPRYLVVLTIYGEVGHQLTFKLYDHSIGQELNLTSPAAVTFTENGYGTPIDPYILNFTSEETITATVDPIGAGFVTGAGNYAIGTICTLTAMANSDYQFLNWTLNGVEVSTNTSYQFIVTESAVYVAHFQHCQNQNLPYGWSWWSTYIEQEGIDGLEMLENSIGTAGIRIQGRTGNADQFEYQGTSYWYGTLNAIENEQMYKIRTNAACNVVIIGDEVQLADHPITINSGWNWIGFPSGQSISLDMAMSGFTPEANDVIKGRNGIATYVSYGNNHLWYGSLTTLEPGQGYMYKSNSSTAKTLTFQSGRSENADINFTNDNSFFTPNVADFSSNMLVTAVIEMDGQEVRSEDYELAAFVGNECRGSVKLMYVEPLDRYIAILLVFGEEEEEIHFVLTDGNDVVGSDDLLTYVVDGIEGTVTEPIILHFGTLGMNDSEQNIVNIFPNPSDGVFNIEGNGIRKIEVFDVYGQVIFSKEIENNSMQIDLSDKDRGMYLLRVITNNGITTNQLIIK